MQMRCRFCNRPFALKAEEVNQALETVTREKLKYFNAHCPHCGKPNTVSPKALKRAAPRWHMPVETEE